LIVQISGTWTGGAEDDVICGDGPDRGRVERLIADEGIQGVEMQGFVQLDELARLYAGAHCFIHPALQEAWGLVVNEALAAGLPVLVSRRAGCAYDLVHEGVNGFTFDPRNVEELAALMHAMTGLSSARLREMGDASQRIVSHFGPEQFATGLAAAIAASGWEPSS
jgi:glycosyltransferase involved in cell wall biosynthesis